MPKLNENALSVDETAARQLSVKLTHVVFALADEAGYTTASFARELGISRVRLSQIKNDTEGKNLWRLPLVCAAARVLHLSVDELVRAASASTNGLIAELTRASHAPTGSNEKLREDLERLITMYSMLMGMEIEHEPWEKKEMEFKCSPLEIGAGVPEFYERFSAGAMPEDEFMSTVWKALNYAEANGWLRKMPFWVALKQVYKPVK